MSRQFPRYHVGHEAEPDYYLVMLAHDSAKFPAPGKTGVGSDFIATLASEKFGPFVAVFSKGYPSAAYKLDRLMPVRNYQYPHDAVKREADYICRLYNQGLQGNMGPWKVARAPDAGKQEKRTPAYRRRLKAKVSL